MDQIPPYRRQRANVSSIMTNTIQKRNPWVVTFFAFSYPGFGNVMQNRYAKGFILIIWELFINQKAKVNLGIMYSLQGHFDTAKAVLDQRWLILYVAIYMYAIWSSYRATVDMNKLSLLVDREDAPIPVFKIGVWDVNFLDKKKPWPALVWSLLYPGLGHLYVHKVIPGLFIFGYTVFITTFSHLPQSIHYLMTGAFEQAKQVLDMQWLMYLPSIYCFVAYDAYLSTVEQNKLFQKEQARFLRAQYQNPQFKMPV